MSAATAKREREATEVASACTRLLVALARRSTNGELEALEALVELQATVDAQLGAAVAGYRHGPAGASWARIAEILGVTRQSAWERFHDPEPEPQP